MGSGVAFQHFPDERSRLTSIGGWRLVFMETNQEMTFIA